MAHTFGELVFGGVLFAPFVTYLVAALAVVMLLRPLLHVAGLAKMFSNPAIAQFSLYVTVLCLLMLLF